MGFAMTFPDQQREAALKAASIAQIEGTQEQALHAHSLLTDYLLDHCPDGQAWEEFDPDIDGARQVIIDAFGV